MPEQLAWRNQRLPGPSSIPDPLSTATSSQVSGCTNAVYAHAAERQLSSGDRTHPLALRAAEQPAGDQQLSVHRHTTQHDLLATSYRTLT